MKRTIIALSLLWVMSAQGQILNVTSIEALNVNRQEDKIAQAVAISPQGDYLLLSSDTKQGLIKMDLDTGQQSVLSNAPGNGSDVRISNDGQQIVYGQVTYKDKRRQQSVKSIDLKTGKERTLVKPTRNLQGFAVDDRTAVTRVDGKMKQHTLSKGAVTSSRPLLSHHHLKLYITVNDVTSQLAPNGADERYIWASLSPDGKRVLYYVSGQGTFVCGLDGSNVIPMGNLTAPKWWDDNTIVGMNETDDEYSIIASAIVARTLDGQEQVLTGADVIATYPLPAAQAGKIAFSTPDGGIYIITVD